MFSIVLLTLVAPASGLAAPARLDDAPTITVEPGKRIIFELPHEYAPEDAYYDEPVIADLSGDGWLDVAAVRQDGRIMLFINRGDGTLSERPGPSLGHRASLTVADTEGDGDSDLAAVGGGLLWILDNDGQGEFNESLRIEVDIPYRRTFVRNLALDDGREAIVLSGRTAVTLVARSAQRTGWDVTRHETSMDISGLWVADFDNDTHLDLFVTSDSLVVLLRGDGEGMLGIPARIMRSNVVLVHDLDRDGEVDLVARVFHRGPPPYDWFLEPAFVFMRGWGTGSFAPVIPLGYKGSPGTTPIVDDLDGNGLPDLVLWDQDFPEENGWVIAYLQRAPGEFQQMDHLGVRGRVSGVASGDLDGDAHADVVATGTAPGLTILFNRGDGQLKSTRHVRLLSFMSAMDVATGHLNGDDAADLVFATHFGQAARIALNDGTGVLSEVQDVFVASRIYAVAIADMTGDGIEDVVALANDYRPNDIGVIRSRGDGTFAPPILSKVGDAADIVLDDFDGDGDIDCVTSNNLELLANDGNGNLTPASVSPFASPDAILDFDGDGLPDIAGRDYDGALQVMKNEGGHFSGSSRFEFPSGVVAVCAGDFDSDGHQDLIAALQDYHLIPLWNDGRGNFEPGEPMVLERRGRHLESIHATDLDADGRLDLAVGDQAMNYWSESATVFVLRNAGGRQFSEDARLSARPFARKIASGDIDDDGIMDLTVANGRPYMGRQGTIYRNATGDDATPISVAVLPDHDDPRKLSKGALRLAVHGSSGFDVRSVDLATLTVAGARPERNGKDAWYRDVNHDGYEDLVVQVRDVSTGPAPRLKKIHVYARQTDGTMIHGVDEVLVSPKPRRAPRAAAVAAPMDVPAAGLAVVIASSNPVRGPVILALNLPTSDPATLEIFDLAGRRISMQALSGPGEQSVSIEPGVLARPGLYLARLTQGAHTRTTRFITLD